jgi:hypothetical protein
MADRPTLIRLVRIYHLGDKTMKHQLTSLINWLLAVVYGLLSNPRHLRLALTVLVVVFALLVLLVPSLTTFADNLSGSGGH